MISVSINLFRDIFPVSMKTVRIQTAQDVEMIQHPRETWYGNILWIPYATRQMYLNTIRDLLSSERHIRHFGYLHQSGPMSRFSTS